MAVLWRTNFENLNAREVRTQAYSAYGWEGFLRKSFVKIGVADLTNPVDGFMKQRLDDDLS